MADHQVTIFQERKAARCSDALRAIFGEFAEEVAALDPFPHLRAVNLPAPGIHLCALALTRRRTYAVSAALAPAPDFGGLISMIFGKRLSQMRAVLRRLPLTCLTKIDYERLDRLVVCEAGRAVLAHGPDINSNLLEILDQVPVQLRRPCIIRHIKTPGAAKLVKIAAVGFAGERTSEERAAFAENLNATRSSQTFWACVEHHLLEQLPSFAPPLNFGDHRFRAITTPRSLLLTARYFENCLADYLGEAMTGEIGFYVWSNGVHRAVIAIRPLVGAPGLIHEIQGPRNGDLPPTVMDQILAPMLRAGFAKGHVVRRRTLVLRKLRGLFQRSAGHDMTPDEFEDSENVDRLLALLDR